MQNIVLGILAYELTGEAWFIGLVTFAQLGPMLIISPIGGAIADRFDRRVVLVSIAVSQMVLSLLLAVVALEENPSKILIVLIVAAIGVGAAVYTPSISAMLPTLAGRENLQGAVALNSAAMNGSRVVGPLLGGAVATLGGASLVFAVNAATYLIAVWAIATVRADFSPRGIRGASPLHQLQDGFRNAAKDPVLARVLLTISVYSFCSLVFIYQMPLVAEQRLQLDELAYTAMFATFAVGAALGALATGSLLVGANRWTITRAGLGVFAVGLAAFATTTSPPIAYAAVFVTGASYFAVVTALSTILQLRVDDRVRGRVMGLWMMGWAGLVPLGGLLAGPLIDAVGIVWVLLFGAAVAAALALAVREPDAGRHGDALAATA
jgi:MFS family permease